MDLWKEAASYDRTLAPPSRGLKTLGHKQVLPQPSLPVGAAALGFLFAVFIILNVTGFRIE